MDFIDTINSNYLTQHVLEPSFGSNFLDLVFTDDPTRIFEVIAGPPLGSTNKMHLHASLTGDLYLKSSFSATTNIVTKRDLSKGNYIEFNNIIDNVINTIIIQNGNVNLSYESLVRAYDRAMTDYVPLKRTKTTIKANPKWFNREVKQATALKYKLYCKLRASNDNLEVKTQYKIACKAVKKVVNMSVLNYETNLVTKCKSNPKMLYSYINNQKTCKEYIRTLTKKNGEITTDKNEIVQILNNQFCEVFNSATNFIEAVPPDQTVKFPSKTTKVYLQRQMSSVPSINLTHTSQLVQMDSIP